MTLATQWTISNWVKTLILRLIALIMTSGICCFAIHIHEIPTDSTDLTFLQIRE